MTVDFIYLASVTNENRLWHIILSLLSCHHMWECIHNLEFSVYPKKKKKKNGTLDFTLGCPKENIKQKILVYIDQNPMELSQYISFFY